MDLNQTPSSERVHIGIFGKTNSGKSSMINKITNQNIAIVSEIEGTTTDPVSKSMEILPIGPVILTDTPGLDDKSILGNLRIEKTFQILNKTDIAVLVVDIREGRYEIEDELLDEIKKRKLPYIIVLNKVDLIDKSELQKQKEQFKGEVYLEVSAKTGFHIEELKNKIADLYKKENYEKKIIADFIKKGDIVVLVIPIDAAAPKGRLILPQQQTIREILDTHGICMVTQVCELSETLKKLNDRPKIVITDSQAFEEVSKIVPEDVLLTSFSILFARYKGNLDDLMESVEQIENLKENDKILISEGCTHHRQCGDIGSVKIPEWLQKHTGKNFQFKFTNGAEFSSDLSEFQMIIHCGGCMLNEKEMKFRIAEAKRQSIPIINYGILISYLKGILKRATQIFRVTV